MNQAIVSKKWSSKLGTALIPSFIRNLVETRADANDQWTLGAGRYKLTSRASINANTTLRYRGIAYGSRKQFVNWHGY